MLAHHERGATLLDHESENAVELPDSPCECTTIECVNRWIGDNIGCNIVIDLVCPSGARGGLVQCTESSPQLTAGAFHE